MGIKHFEVRIVFIDIIESGHMIHLLARLSTRRKYALYEFIKVFLVKW